MTATVTETPTITPTATSSGPFEYVVQEEDNCTTIAEEFDVDVEVLLFLNNLDSSCYITVGQTIMIPAAGQEMPTRTPVPTDTVPGTKIPYTVSAGDALSVLAEEFLSDVDRIIEETNKYRKEEGLDPLEDENDIKVGDILMIPVFISTPVPTVTSTANTYFDAHTLIKGPFCTGTQSIHNSYNNIFDDFPGHFHGSPALSLIGHTCLGNRRSVC